MFVGLLSLPVISSYFWEYLLPRASFTHSGNFTFSSTASFANSGSWGCAWWGSRGHFCSPTMWCETQEESAGSLTLFIYFIMFENCSFSDLGGGWLFGLNGATNYARDGCQPSGNPIRWNFGHRGEMNDKTKWGSWNVSNLLTNIIQYLPNNCCWALAEHLRHELSDQIWWEW